MALTDNLISYWKLDESSGNAADSVNSHTLTKWTGASYVSAKINNWLSSPWGATNDNNCTTDWADFNTSAFSVSLWMKSSTNWWHFMSYMGDNSNEELLFWIGWAGGFSMWWTAGKPTVYMSNKWATWISWAVSINDNNRHHIVLVVNTSYIKIYVDGVLDLDQTQSGTWSTTDRTLYIFNRFTTFWAQKYNSYNGTMDEIGRWTRTLASDEVTSLYNWGNGLQYPFSSIKTINWLAKASVKTVNGLAIANVKTFNWLA